MRYIFKRLRYKLLISLIDTLGYILFFPFRLFWKRKPGNVGSILLIRLDHIGDLICATPVPQNLKEHYKGAKVTFLVADWAKQIVMSSPYIDEVICYDAPWFDRDNRRIFEFKRFFKLAAELHKHHYDIGIDLRGDLRHILLMALAGIKYRVSYGITGGGFLLTQKPVYRPAVHAVEHNLDILKALNIDIKDAKTRIYSSDKDKAYIDKFLEENNISADDFLVTIHAHPGYPANKWHEEKFIKLIKALHKDYSAKTVLIGSYKDEKDNDNIIIQAGAKVVNAAGKTSLASLAVLLEKSSL
jgi:ADP-heptose:LPS heptosyltransferase